MRLKAMLLEMQHLRKASNAKAKLQSSIFYVFNIC